MLDLLTNINSRGYLLSLSDGSRWWITGDEENIYRNAEFASILKLDECAFSNCPRIFFSKQLREDNSINPKTNFFYPALNHAWVDMGWNSYFYGFVRIWYNINHNDVICEFMDRKNAEKTKYNSLWFSIQPIYRNSIKKGGLTFHCGFAEYNGKGVLSAARGETGKSTCCRRLPNPWRALCDDEALIVLTESHEYRVHPFPTWSDYIVGRAKNRWDVNYSVPLSAIFFIEQAPNDEIILIEPAESTMLIMASASQTWEKYLAFSNQWYKIGFRKEVLNNAIKIAKQIPAYRLRVSLTGRFWEEIEKVI